MSIMQRKPPQTYSRLFRPWDVKNSQDKFDNSAEFANKTDLTMLDKTQFCNTMVTSSIDSIATYDPVHGAHIPLDTINMYPTNSLPIPLFGMDSLTISLMEQEYARVIAEDAQIRAINARKQRPKKFKCPHCDVAFSNNGQLKGHIRIHTGERPFKCDVESCSKTFTRNEELTRHKRIHTGLRPFGCTICGKKFGRRDHLKKHTKTHVPQDRSFGPALFVPMYPYLYGYQ